MPFCRLRFRCFPVPPVMLVMRSGRGRGTRRPCAGVNESISPSFSLPPEERKPVAATPAGSTSGRALPGACSWCQSMGARAPSRCTWKARGPQDKFVSPACVRDACFGHMVASVWSGARVRQENKDRLKRFLSNSVEELAGSGEEPAQHAWAVALLDACKLQELRCRRLHSSSESDSSDSGGGVPSSERDTHACSLACVPRLRVRQGFACEFSRPWTGTAHKIVLSFLDCSPSTIFFYIWVDRLYFIYSFVTL